MKVTFILPAIGKKQNEKYIGTWKMEPLTIAVLKALTPKGIETEFFDDRIELINYDTNTDVVAITVESYTAARAYYIAEQFKKRGKKVVMGGYHATLMQDEVVEHCDSVVIGNAEEVWEGLLEDIEKDVLKKIYKGNTVFKGIEPDRSIFNGKKYLPITLIETGRGCPHSCEFCAISAYYKSCYKYRDPKEIANEIKKTKNKLVFFIDDNIIANRDFAISLFKEITPLNIKWTSQGSLNIAKDEELLQVMRKSGCETLLIGFESLDEENLVQMKKEWTYKLGEIDSLVNTIHNSGISIYATFVFGFDNDTPEMFKRVQEFSNKHKFFFAAFNHLLPFPGTKLYERLKNENLLIHEKWWLHDDYYYGDIAFNPKKMTNIELSNSCADARRKFYKFSSIAKRGMHLLKINRNPWISLIFWSQNIKLGIEVDGKLRIPIGRGLDELPK